MATVPAPDPRFPTLKVGPFNLGMNTRLPDTKLVTKDGTFLRSAVNVDVTSVGTIKRRAGYAQALTGSNCHSLHCSGEIAYVADGQSLYYLTGSPDNLTKTLVRSDLPLNTRLTYTDGPDGLVYSDGITNYVLDRDSQRLLNPAAFLADSFAIGMDEMSVEAADRFTRDKLPLPGGSIIRHNNGRYMVAQGAILYYADPFSVWYDPSQNFITFTSNITVLEPLTNGFYVATEDSTFYFAGGVTDTAAKKILPYGGVPGTGGSYPDKLRCFWMSTRGLIDANDNGDAVNVQENAIAMNSAKAGATLFREEDGTKQVVTSLFGSDTTGAVATSYMDAEVIRKGVTL